MPEGVFTSFVIWAVIWIFLLVIPPGSTSIFAAYRLNFCHGVISTVLALCALKSLVPENFCTMCTISYFVVDFLNIMLNDFVWKVPSYQNPQNRRVEYAHHLFCLTVGITSQFCHKSFCTFDKNPFIYLMFAEFSTPFLMLWRHYGGDILGAIFVVTFFGCRIIYHGFIFIPHCMRVCIPAIGYGFGIPYNLLNCYFFYMIMKKVLKPKKGEPAGEAGVDDKIKKG